MATDGRLSSAHRVSQLLEQVDLPESPRSVEELRHLLPEIDVMIGVEQPREHYWDVFEHALRTVQAINRFITTLAEHSGASRSAGLRSAQAEPHGLAGLAQLTLDAEQLQVLASHLFTASTYPTRVDMLRLAGLLHDIGKPSTKMVTRGRMTFHRHAIVGAEIASDALARLGLPTKAVEQVATMVSLHMRPWILITNFPPTDRAVRRFNTQTRGTAFEILLLSLADHAAMRGPNLAAEAWERHIRASGYIIDRLVQDAASARVPERLLNGDEIMQELGIGPGPVIGEILSQIENARRRGAIRTSSEARALVHRFWSRRNTANLENRTGVDQRAR